MFYKEVQDTMPDKNGNKLWRPEIVRTGRTVDIKKLSKAICAATTLTPADVAAVLYSLPRAMDIYLREGHTVRLDWLGTFTVYGRSRGRGVLTKEEVHPSQFSSLVVKFTPEYTLSAVGTHERMMLSDVEFINVKAISAKANREDSKENV